MKIQITALYRDEGYISYEEIQDWDICENTSEVYKTALREFGRCISKIHIDDKGGKAKHIGWVFEKKYQYRDTNESYIQETWITPLKSYKVKHVCEYAL